MTEDPAFFPFISPNACLIISVVSWFRFQLKESSCNFKNDLTFQVYLSDNSNMAGITIQC